MTTYYDLTLKDDVPHGSDILNRPCKITFYYPGGSHSDTFSATVFAWLQPRLIRVTSAHMNMQSSWQGAEYGIVKIELGGGGTLDGRIVGFGRVGAEAAAEGAS